VIYPPPIGRHAYIESGRWRHLIALVAVSMLGAVGGHEAPKERAPYDVLLISIDTVRQDMLGCHGRHPRYAPALTTTPRMDRLAAEREGPLFPEPDVVLPTPGGAN
jgi:hypothetical protein